MNHRSDRILDFPHRHPWPRLSGGTREGISGNKLLAELSAIQALTRLRPVMTTVQLERGELLHDFNRPPSHVYFPTTAVVSLYRATASGGSSELVSVGQEGMIGISVLTGGETSAGQAAVVIPGVAWRMPADALRQECASNPACQSLLLRYLHALLMDIFHRMSCNTHHRIRQRLCRLLLQMLDRSLGDELAATHETIANRLGVRRESISEAARTLQRAGLIRNRRGRICIRDRSGLERLSCECYGLIKAEYDRLFAAELRKVT
jgi:CRP-like cAMP-binding protein